MQNMNRVCFFGWLVCLITLGCGGSDRVPVYPVKGYVALDGSPMKGGGAITLIPVGNQRGKGAGGIIEEDGSYSLSTYGTNDGSMAGEFHVIISQTVYDEPVNNGDSDSGGWTGEAVERVPADQRIPVIYSDPTQTPLTAKIEPRENDIDFLLMRKP